MVLITELKMRAVVMTDELVEAAWKFTVKSVRMGAATGNHFVAEKAGRLSFHQRVQLMISVCFGMFFCTLVLFVLCAFDDPAGAAIEGGNIPRRILQSWNSPQWNLRAEGRRPAAALQGMGVLFRRGSRAMNELIVAHLTESASESEVRTFLRTLHRSGAMARADLVLLFPNRGSLADANASAVVEAENLSYRKLSACLLSTADLADRRCAAWSSGGAISAFNAPAFRRAAEEVAGKRRRRRDGRDHSVPCEGSILGFGVEELDPGNALAAFIDDPPAQLRRWVCYQMLLGLLRHRIRSVMLVRIGAAVILGDPLASVRSSAGGNNNNLLLWMEPRSWDIAAREDQSYAEMRLLRNSQNRGGCEEGDAAKSKRRPKSHSAAQIRCNKSLLEAVYGAGVWGSLDGEEDKRRRLISSGVILGAMGPVRGLCNAMVNELIRVTLERKSRERFPDQIPLSYLVHRRSVLGRKITDNLQLLDGRRPSFNGTAREVFGDATKYGVVDGLSDDGSWASVAELINRDLCSSPHAAALYPDCIAQPPPSDNV